MKIPTCTCGPECRPAWSIEDVVRTLLNDAAELNKEPDAVEMAACIARVKPPLEYPEFYFNVLVEYIEALIIAILSEDDDKRPSDT
jgi:hypothetical protein